MVNKGRSCRGQDKPNAKLTDIQVRAIRRQSAILDNDTLSIIYGVSERGYRWYNSGVVLEASSVVSNGDDREWRSPLQREPAPRKTAPSKKAPAKGAQPSPCSQEEDHYHSYTQTAERAGGVSSAQRRV